MQPCASGRLQFRLILTQFYKGKNIAVNGFPAKRGNNNALMTVLQTLIQRNEKYKFFLMIRSLSYLNTWTQIKTINNLKYICTLM